MKGLFVAVAGLGVGGAAYFGIDGPDFDRVVDRRPIEVYAAFSALAPEGTRTHGPSGEVAKSVTLRVAKQRGEAITYEILFDNRPVVTAELNFEAAGEDGRQTRMTAELELDEYELGSAFETEGGIALSMVPEGFVDMQFANFMDDMARDVEAGRPLAPLGLNSAGLRRHNPDANVHARRRNAEEARQSAARPMSRARPMVDPNRAAETYRNGASARMDPPDPAGGWGR
ncbi:MAG TPA: hypothetical protein VEW71_08705 [Allosphingosinicella sp.]|nr:hypothetical protein [Allosphingosinicella sp.]